MKQNSQNIMRTKIMNESASCFLKKGFKGTTVQDIADSLGLTKGAIYWHFKSKDDILEAILDEYDRSFLDRLIETVELLKGDYIDKFMQYHRFSTEFARDNYALCVVFVTLTGEMIGSSKELEKKIKRIYQKYHTFLCSFLEDGKRGGFVRNEIETSLLADAIIGIQNGILLQWHIKHNDINGAEFSRAYRRIVMYGKLKEGIRQRRRATWTKKNKAIIK